jgi:hypothetical protein
MALSDKDKDILRLPLMAASFLDSLGKTTGMETFTAASSAMQFVPVEKIAETLAVMRTDEVFIQTGSMEIDDDVAIEIFDEDGEP